MIKITDLLKAIKDRTSRVLDTQIAHAIFKYPPTCIQSAFGYSDTSCTTMVRVPPRHPKIIDKNFMRYTSIKEKKTAQFRIRYTPAEKAEIEKCASDAGLTMSEYLRRRALGRRVMSIADEKIINELRRIGGLLKHVHNTSGGVYSAETASVLGALKSVIQAIGFKANHG